jgi:hypothetical protein
VLGLEGRKAHVAGRHVESSCRCVGCLSFPNKIKGVYSRRETKSCRPRMKRGNGGKDSNHHHGSESLIAY